MDRYRAERLLDIRNRIERYTRTMENLRDSFSLSISSIDGFAYMDKTDSGVGSAFNVLPSGFLLLADHMLGWDMPRHPNDPPRDISGIWIPNAEEMEELRRFGINPLMIPASVAKMSDESIIAYLDKLLNHPSHLYRMTIDCILRDRPELVYRHILAMERENALRGPHIPSPLMELIFNGAPYGQTWVFGTEVSAQWVARGNLAQGIAIDSHGNRGIVDIVSGGMNPSAGASVGGFFMRVDTPLIQDLMGRSIEVGGSIDTPIGIIAGLPMDVSGGFELTFMRDGYGEPVSGRIYTISVGPSIGGIPGIDGFFQNSYTFLTTGSETIPRAILGQQYTYVREIINGIRREE